MVFFLFTGWTNNIITKIDGRINFLNKNLYQDKNQDTLSSSTVASTLDQFYKNLMVYPIYKARNNVALICKHFLVSVVTKTLGLRNNDQTSTQNEINDFSYNHIVNKNVSDLTS